MTMAMIREVISYLKHGRSEFHHEAKEKEQIAERSYQSSMTSAVDVARSARLVRTNADFLKEVLKGNG